MKLLNGPGRQPAPQIVPRRVTRLLAAPVAEPIAALIFLMAIGCASPGPPRPPSLNLPQVVNDLTAQRIGDDVELHWITPAKTTDNLNVKGPIIAEICRESRSIAPPAKPESQPAPSCISTKRIAVTPGPSQTIDTLPANLTADPLTLLAYRIQIFNDTGHTAGLSPRAFTAAGTAPPLVRLRATSTRSGVQLEWPQASPPYPVELERLLVPQPTPVPAPHAAAAPTPPANSKPKPAPKSAAKQPLEVAPPTPAEVHLLADNQPTDAGGTVDRTAQKGQTYQYVAQRVRKVTLDTHAIELRSLPSPTITIAMRDTFPPARPTGLEAIPGATSTPEGATQRSIDLSWEPDTEPDLAGYYVYRQETSPAGTPSGTATRLTPTPLLGPGFSDKTAIPGHHYAYFVTAVDTTGNESAPSATVVEILTEQ